MQENFLSNIDQGGNINTNKTQNKNFNQISNLNQIVSNENKNINENNDNNINKMNIKVNESDELNSSLNDDMWKCIQLMRKSNYNGNPNNEPNDLIDENRLRCLKKTLNELDNQQNAAQNRVNSLNKLTNKL